MRRRFGFTVAQCAYAHYEILIGQSDYIYKSYGSNSRNKGKRICFFILQSSEFGRIAQQNAHVKAREFL